MLTSVVCKQAHACIWMRLAYFFCVRVREESAESERMGVRIGHFPFACAAYGLARRLLVRHGFAAAALFLCKHGAFARASGAYPGADAAATTRDVTTGPLCSTSQEIRTAEPSLLYRPSSVITIIESVSRERVV
jgi:hypothetical protein